MPDDPPAKRPGRPRVDPREPSTSIGVTVPASTYDRLFRLAHERRLTIPDVCRLGIKKLLEHDDSTR